MASIASIFVPLLLLGTFVIVLEGGIDEARANMDALIGCLIKKAGAEPQIKAALGHTMSKLFGDKCALNAEQTAEITQSSLKFVPKNMSDFADRLYEAGKSCLLDGEDVSKCCKNKGVSDSCMSLCGRKNAPAIDRGDANFCRKYGRAIIKCQINATDAEPKTVQYSIIPCRVGHVITLFMTSLSVIPVVGPAAEGAWTLVSLGASILDEMIEDSLKNTNKENIPPAAKLLGEAFGKIAGSVAGKKAGSVAGAIAERIAGTIASGIDTISSWF